MSDLIQLRRKVDTLLSERDHIKRRIQEEKQTLKELSLKLKNSQEAQGIIQEIAQGLQTEAHSQIATVVTRCLKAVFGEDGYELRVKFEKRRGRTEADFVFVRDGHEIDPIEASGGASVDIASMALRIAHLMLARPARRKFLCLDEPCKHLDKDNKPRVGNFLMTLAKETGIQILLVTHAPELAVGKVIEL